MKGVLDNLVGRKFGNLTVLSHYKVARSAYGTRHYWKCLCGCGKQRIVQSGHLQSGHTRSCGCIRKIFTKAEVGLRVLASIYKTNAVERNIEFTLSIEECGPLFLRNCHYCGTQPSNRMHRKHGNGEIDLLYNGIDRLDNDKGYCTDNCVPCCAKCNIAKNDMSYKDFVHLCKSIAERHSV